MALFSRNFYQDDDLNFGPVFRFIDAFDTWNNKAGQGQGASLRQQLRSFSPKFDLVETKNAYELHGEIPGVDKKDISIEFTEPHTLVVRGRVERKYSSGTPPNAGQVEGGDKPAGAITEGGEKQAPGSPTSESHRATVTDEATEAARERGTPATDDDKQIAAHGKGGEVGRNAPRASKFWVQERSIGEFHRAFNLPGPVDEAAVTASLNNGILHVTIPKQEKRNSRRVQIA